MSGCCPASSVWQHWAAAKIMKYPTFKDQKLGLKLLNLEFGKLALTDLTESDGPSVILCCNSSASCKWPCAWSTFANLSAMTVMSEYRLVKTPRNHMHMTQKIPSVLHVSPLLHSVPVDVVQGFCLAQLHFAASKSTAAEILRLQC